MINSRFLLSAGNGLIFLVEILGMNINNKSATYIFFFLTTFTLLTAAVKRIKQVKCMASTLMK